MLSFLNFGKKKRKTRSKKGRKPPAKILKMCRRFKIKCTKKVGKRRVYKSASALKKQLKRKMRKSRKSRRKSRKSRKSRRRRVSRFGFSFVALKGRRSRFGATPAAFNQPGNYGYNQAVVQNPGILSQTSQVVTSGSNSTRPQSMQLGSGNIPTYGTNRKFFTESVPTMPPPEWFVMGQPDGPPVPVGSPFYGYKTPFGRRRKVRRTRRRYNVKGSKCNKLKARKCRSDPNCTYTKRGCRRRKSTASKGVVYEGPSLEFGRRRRRRN
jgi:hypothetical protein